MEQMLETANDKAKLAALAAKLDYAVDLVFQVSSRWEDTKAKLAEETARHEALKEVALEYKQDAQHHFHGEASAKADARYYKAKLDRIPLWIKRIFNAD